MLKSTFKALIVTGFSLLMTINAVKAQKLDWQNYQQVVVYKLDNHQVSLLYNLWQKNKQGFSNYYYLDSAVFYTREVARQRLDTQKINLQKFGPGGYLWVSIQNLQMPYVQFTQNSLYSVQQVLLNGKYILYVKDSAGRIIKDAKVKVDSFDLKYNSALGGYAYVKTNKKHVERYVYLEVKGEVAIYNYSFYVPYTNPNRDKTVKNKKYKYENLVDGGYFVNSQPVYRIGDTVRYKAFLVNRKGKPVKRKAELSISQNNPYYIDGRTMSIKPGTRTLKPAYPGAYDGWFTVPDTWKNDQYYTLTIYEKKSKNRKTVSFKVEDYELDLTDQSVKAIKNSANPGESVVFLAEHKDKNGLPIMDGRIRMNVRLAGITRFDTQWLEIPQKHYYKYKSYEKSMDPSGVTEFKIPFDSFYNAEGSYYADFYFIGSDYSVDSIKGQVIYTGLIGEKWDPVFRGDSVKVNYLYKNKNIEKSIELRFTNPQGRIVKSLKTTTGKTHSVPLEALYCSYYYGDTFIGNMYVSSSNPYTLKGSRNNDSVHISLKGIRGITFNYRIYKMATLIDSGEKAEINFNQKDESEASYHIYFTHNFLGNIENNWQVASYHVKESNLNVRFIHPENIYPGQKVAAEIVVTDVHNKPVKNVNLAAYGINTQLPGIAEPYVAYMGKTKPDEYLNKQNNALSFTPVGSYFRFNNEKVKLFKMQNYPFSRLVFAKKGICVISDSSKHTLPQIQVYAHSGAGKLEPVYYILDNNKLIYHEHFVPKTIPSIALSEGKHHFKVRLRNRIVEFDVDSMKGQKAYYFGFNLDSLNQHKGYKDTTNIYVYNAEEQEMIRKHAFYLAYKFPYNYYLSVKINNLSLNGDLRPFGVNDFRQYGRYDKGDFYYAIGPVDSGTQRIKINNYDYPLNFLPGKKYVLFDNEIAMAEWKEKKGISDLGLYPSNISYDFGNLHRNIVDSVKPVPPQIYVNPPAPLTVYRRGTIAGAYAPSYLLKDESNTTLHLLNTPPAGFDIWLFNQADSQYSLLGQNQSWFEFHRKGNYELMIVSDTGYVLFPVKYFRNDTGYNLNLKYVKWRSNKQEELFPYINRALEIVGNNFYSFSDTPTVYKPIVQAYKIKSTLSEVRGVVLNQENNEPVEGVRILLEKDGVFVSGSVTNHYGKFSMPNLPAGKYQIKFSHQQYKYRVYYQLEVGSNQLLKLGMAMKPFFYNKNTGELNYEWDFGNEAADMSYTSAGATAGSYNMNVDKLESVSISRAPANFMVEAKGRAMKKLSALTKNKAQGYDESRKDYYENDMYASDADGVADFNDREESFGGKYKMEDEKIQQKDIGKKPLKSLRTNFRESAFWVPNLYTDQKGKAHFTALYPDNITSWQLYAPAVNGKRQSGLGSFVVKSYLPVSTNLIMPNFMVEGDKFVIKSRLVNYSGQLLDAETRFTFNGTGGTKNIKLDKTYMDSVLVIAPKAGDSANLISTVKLSNGYEDGEKRFIISKPNAVLETKGIYYALPKDTVITIVVPAEVETARLIINKTAFEHILDLLSELENYPYGCVEQTATKLKGLLLKQSIMKKIGGTFEQEKEIKTLMSNLKKWQGKDGSWGWWPGSSSNGWMTAYVSDVMYYAQQSGYGNRNYIEAEKYLGGYFSTFDNNTKVFVIHILKKQNADVKFNELEQSVNKVETNNTEKLEWMRYQQLSGKGIAAKDLKLMLVRDGNGGLFVPGSRYSFYSDEARNTYLAYLILRDQDPSAPELKRISNYFTSGIRVPGHTVARIQGIEVALDHALFTETGKNVLPDLWVNGTKINNDKLPYTQKFKPGDVIKVENKGAESFMYVTTDVLRKSMPQNQTDLLRISTKIDKSSDTFVKAHTASVSVLTATVTAVESMEYTMVEIPIPAGCSYAKKWNGTLPGETYREYRYDRVIVYFEKLPQGKYTIDIPLQNRFEGEFNIPPSRAAMMYYTEAAGYEKAKKYVLAP